MSFVTSYFGYWDYWQLYHKVTFDGINKLITINADETNISVKENLYSDWKEWLKVEDNGKFLPAFRTIGGDPINIPAGLYAGDTYFLTNGWRVVIPHNVNISGVLYTEEGDSPYIVQPGGGVIATVSNLVQTVVTQTAAVNTPTEIANAVKITLTPDLYTPAQIASAVRTELSAELAIINSQIDGLTPTQATMLLEMYQILGLDPTAPLVITQTSRTVGVNITQVITGDNETINTITRQ